MAAKAKSKVTKKLKNTTDWPFPTPGVPVIPHSSYCYCDDKIHMVTYRQP